MSPSKYLSWFSPGFRAANHCWVGGVHIPVVASVPALADQLFESLRHGEAGEQSLHKFSSDGFSSGACNYTHRPATKFENYCEITTIIIVTV